MTNKFKPFFAVILIGVVAVLFARNLWESFRKEKEFQKKIKVSHEKEIRAPETLLSEFAKPEKIDVSDFTKLASGKVARAGLSMRKAEYWKPMENKEVRCFLCPRKCVIPNGYSGQCRARVNIGGILRTIVYGKPVAIHVDPIEKKPLFHFFPETKAFSIAAAGCNLKCVFCQNWEISQARPEKTRHLNIPPEQVVAQAIRSGSKSIAYTYTEPTIFFEYMRDTAKLAREIGLKNVYISCGYIEEKPLRELCKYIDAANVDLKGFSEEFYSEYTSGTLYPVLRTFKILKEEGVWAELTNLIIPGANDTPQDISNLCEWIVTEIGTEIPVHFSRFFPNFKVLDRPPTPLATLNMAIDIAKSFGIKYIYAGNVAGSKYESTYCHGCRKKIIGRRGYFISEINIKDGKCEFCGTKIPGRW